MMSTLDIGFLYRDLNLIPSIINEILFIVYPVSITLVEINILGVSLSARLIN